VVRDPNQCVATRDACSLLPAIKNQRTRSAHIIYNGSMAWIEVLHPQA